MELAADALAESAHCLVLYVSEEERGDGTGEGEFHSHNGSQFYQVHVMISKSRESLLIAQQCMISSLFPRLPSVCMQVVPVQRSSLAERSLGTRL